MANRKEMKSFLTRMDLTTYRKLRYIANRDCRSINQQINYLALHCIRVYEKTYGAIDESLLTDDQQV